MGKLSYVVVVEGRFDGRPSEVHGTWRDRGRAERFADSVNEQVEKRAGDHGPIAHVQPLREKTLRALFRRWGL